jgi:hypothetical protein
MKPKKLFILFSGEKSGSQTFKHYQISSGQPCLIKSSSKEQNYKVYKNSFSNLTAYNVEINLEQQNCNEQRMIVLKIPQAGNEFIPNDQVITYFQIYQLPCKLCKVEKQLL